MTDRCLALLAQVPAWDWSLAVYGAVLGVVLILGAWLIALAGKWRRAAAVRNDLLSPSDQLAHFRLLYEQGAINEEEFNRLRGLLGKQMREALDLPAGPTAAAADPGKLPTDNTPPPGQSAPPQDGFFPT